MLSTALFLMDLKCSPMFMIWLYLQACKQALRIHVKKKKTHKNLRSPSVFCAGKRICDNSLHNIPGARTRKYALVNISNLQAWDYVQKCRCSNISTVCKRPKAKLQIWQCLHRYIERAWTSTSMYVPNLWVSPGS